MHSNTKGVSHEQPLWAKTFSFETECKSLHPFNLQRDFSEGLDSPDGWKRVKNHWMLEILDPISAVYITLYNHATDAPPVRGLGLAPYLKKTFQKPLLYQTCFVRNLLTNVLHLSYSILLYISRRLGPSSIDCIDMFKNSHKCSVCVPLHDAQDHFPPAACRSSHLIAAWLFGQSKAPAFALLSSILTLSQSTTYLYHHDRVHYLLWRTMQKWLHMIYIG